jgi:hypothetical protein
VGRPMKRVKRRGRPLGTTRGGPGTLVGVRLSAELLAKVDAFRRSHPELPNRAEAIRIFIKMALKD